MAARTLGELLVERDRVQQLVALERRVYEAGDKAKFLRLRELLRDTSFV